MWSSYQQLLVEVNEKIYFARFLITAYNNGICGYTGVHSFSLSVGINIHWQKGRSYGGFLGEVNFAEVALGVSESEDENLCVFGLV